MAIPHLADYPMPKVDAFPANRVFWQPDPSRAVLLVHDMQRYFLGFYEPDSALIRRLIDNLVSLRRWADAHRIPVVYTAQPHQQSPAERALLNDMWGPGLTAVESDMQRVVDELAPNDSDTVLVKWRYSAFQRSDLANLLKRWGRDQLIIGGVYAHIGCLVTALDAFMNDIQPFLVGDAVADFSEADHHMALRYVATRCGRVIDTAALVGVGTGEPSREWLLARVRQLIDDEGDIDLDENLLCYGLDSIQVMTLAGELRERGIQVSFEDLARAPTVNAWCALIESQRAAA
ncbi:isochorismatase family protein [Telmatospirillum sp. J64-1]|uniref:isochorismatase family protein n=1 Tax=Telmatospirillum sp. J64-1 TaxID=2502183 RepID=UPI00115CBAC4|nr:isochorismatase family protein [Telmatospirillum sp. J64-1]